MFEILAVLLSFSIIAGFWFFSRKAPPERAADNTESDKNWIIINDLKHKIFQLEREHNKYLQRWHELEQCAETNPDMTLTAFFVEYLPRLERAYTPVSKEVQPQEAAPKPVLEEAVIHEIDDRFEEELPQSAIKGAKVISEAQLEPVQVDKIASTEALQEHQTVEVQTEPVRQLESGTAKPLHRRFIKAKTAPRSEFNWRNWYSDNAINLLLFLGAFLVVAAVSFFISIQWGNLSGVTRFGIVLTFTAAWYVAGFLFNRGESFKTVGITFVTIGAILTPFCGVAYQQFVIGSMEAVGLTWLITSTFATVSYVALSLIFQRRYFTYFGTLSILAMLLALVRVANAPNELFVLAGTVTALILLLGRIALRYFPYLNNYMGQDYENSSIGIMVLSLVAGFALLPIQNIPFFSIQITIVAVSTSIYLWVYSTAHENNRDTLTIAAQVLTIVTILHGTISLQLEPALMFAVVLGGQLLLQVILHFAYRHHARLLHTTHLVSLLTSVGIYIASIAFKAHPFVALCFALVLMSQLSFYALRFQKLDLFHVVVALSYAVLGHSLLWMEIDYNYWGFAFIMLGVVELAAAYLPVASYLRNPLRNLGLAAVILSGSAGMYFTGSTNAQIPYYLYFAALGVLLGFGLVEERRHEKLITPHFHTLSAFIGVGFYLLSSLNYPIPYGAVVLTALVAVQFVLAYRHTRYPALAGAFAIVLYVLLIHLLRELAVADNWWGITLLLLAVAQIAMLYSGFERNWRLGVAYVGMVGLGVTVLWMNQFDISFATTSFFTTLNYLMGFCAIAIYGFISYRESNSTEKLLHPNMHLIGVFTALSLALVSYMLNQVLLTEAYVISAIALLFIGYRHTQNKSYVLAAIGLTYLSGCIGYFFKLENAFTAYLINWLAISILLGFAFVEERFKSIAGIPQLHILSAFVGVGYYLLTSMFYPLAFAQASLAALATIQFVFVYRHTRQATVAGAFAIMLYPFLIHLMQGLGINDIPSWAITLLLLAAAQVAMLYSGFERRWRQGIAYVGIVSLGAVALWGNYFALWSTEYRVVLITSLLALAIYGFVSYREINHVEKLLHPGIHLLGVMTALGLATLGYLFDLPFIAAGYIIGAIVLLLLAYQHIDRILYIIGAGILGYFAITFTLWGLGDNYTQLGALFYVAYSALLLGIGFAPFSEKIRRTTASLGVLGLTGCMAIATATYLTVNDNLLVNHLTAWVSIGILIAFAVHQQRSEQPLVNRYLHMLPTMSLGLLYVASLESEMPFLTVGYALALIVFLMQDYWRSKWTFYIFGIVMMLYVALVNTLMAFNLPYEIYGAAIAVLSIVIYLLREQIVEANAVKVLVALVMLILGATSLAHLQLLLSQNNQDLYLGGWISGYTLLGIFWHSQFVGNGRVRDWLMALGLYLQYLWHIYYGYQFLNPSLFQNIQWLTVGLGIVVLALTLREASRRAGQIPREALVVAAAILLLPAYAQSLTQGWLYTGLAIAYALLIVGVGVVYRHNISQILGAGGVVIAILIPTGNFLRGLPTWVFVLSIGFGLIVIAVVLTILRRDLKKLEKRTHAGS